MLARLVTYTTRLFTGNDLLTSNPSSSLTIDQHLHPGIAPFIAYLTLSITLQTTIVWWKWVTNKLL